MPSSPSLKLGGLIVLSLFLRRWEIPHCFDVFNAFARQFFRKGQQKLSIFGCLKNVIKCWIFDGRYNVNALEDFLKEQFGNGRMFDQAKGVSGTKVAVTATGISDAFPFVFSNYNGIGARDAECG